MAIQEQKWQETADQTDRPLRLNPVGFPRAWMINALSNYYLKDFDVAEKSAREGISRDTGHHFPVMHRVVAVILAQKAGLHGVGAELAGPLKFAPNATDLDQVKKQLAEVEKFAGPEEKK